MDYVQEACDEVPEEFFRELHLGVIVSDEVKVSPYAKNNDLLIMGEYRHFSFGNQIVIYYGSFMRGYGYMNDVQIKEKIRATVRHEFRHHLENLADMHGKDSLEYEDIVDLKKYLENN